MRCVGWKDHGDFARNKRQRREERTVEKKSVILATGSFDANCGLWVWNKDRFPGGDALATGNGEQQSVPGAFKTEDEVERDFTRAGDDEADEDEEWHFSTLLTGPDSEIKDLEFSPPHYGANLLATCSRDKSVWVWEEVEPEEWETVAVLSEHTGDVKCVTWLNGARTTRGELKQRLAASSGASDDLSEEIILGGRELLATGSYDDTIRLHHDDEAEGDWLTIAVLTGHEGTVWDLKFESFINITSYPSGTSVEEVVVDWAPRLLSCSDDMTIRLWKKKLSEKEQDEKRERIAEVRQGLAATNGEAPAAVRQTGFSSNRIPSVIRPPTSTEKWVEDARLPTAHVRSVYAVDWSEKTGLIVSCGGDGVIAVYQELPRPVAGDVVMNGTSEHEDHQGNIQKVPTEWEIIATINDAHDEYEVNHVCWAPRRDQRRHESLEDGDVAADEEYIISTGDDGQVRVWRLPEEVLRSIQ